MQYSAQYNQSYPRKIQIDNVDIMDAFCKAMFLLSYMERRFNIYSII